MNQIFKKALLSRRYNTEGSSLIDCIFIDIGTIFRSSIIFFSCLIPIAIAANQSIRCWVDDEGMRACGDVIPPDQAQRGYQTINRQGLVKKEVAKEKTEQELKKQRQLAAAKRREQLKKEERIRQDAVLLNTFVSVEDIERARDAQINVVESNIGLAKNRNKRTQVDIEKYTKVATSTQNTEQINLLKQRIENNNEYIAQQNLIKKKILQDYSKKIERFNKLKEGS